MILNTMDESIWASNDSIYGIREIYLKESEWMRKRWSYINFDFISMSFFNAWIHCQRSLLLLYIRPNPAKYQFDACETIRLKRDNDICHYIVVRILLADIGNENRTPCFITFFLLHRRKYICESGMKSHRAIKKESLSTLLVTVFSFDLHFVCIIRLAVISIDGAIRVLFLYFQKKKMSFIMFS